MEEADLLKERLQAITDKRRVQEDIAKKRRQIEEEKLKLQYLKKKALREQWLMDGLSGQSEEEQEAMRTQAQDDQQQTKLLQSNISRIEEEIVALESEEIRISSNEERILKRLKEVEKTPEDIIREINADIPQEPVQYIYSPIPDIPKTYKPSLLRKKSPKQEPDGEPKRAMFAMEINVELDKRTGESQVLSSQTITTDDIQSKGVKVFDDGRKSVYALSSDGRALKTDVVDELSPGDVEELLRKATEKKIPADVEYHEPVYSSPYSRPNTPRKSDRDQNSPAPNGLWTPTLTPTPSPLPADRQATPSPRPATLTPLHIPDSPPNRPSPGKLSPYSTPRNAQMNGGGGGGGGVKGTDGRRLSPARSPMPGHQGMSHYGEDSGVGLGRLSPFNSMMEDTRFSFADELPSDIDPSEPVTMIFMGYQTAEDEEDEGFQAELIVIGDEEEEELNNDGSQLSFHPEGYRSKVFTPNKTNMHRSEVKPSSIRNRSQPRADDPSATGTRKRPGATTEVTEVDGKEVSEGSSPSQNQNQAESPSKAVTMETSEQLETGNIADFEQESQETELPENESACNNDEQECYEEFLESMGSKVVVDILADLPPSVTDPLDLDDIPCPKEALILEATPEELNHDECVTSPLSDAPSSRESVCENEIALKAEEPQEEDQPEDALPDVLNTEEPEDNEDAMEAFNPMPTDDVLDNLACDEVEESMLEQYIREEALSEVSTESCHDPEELDECLRVEIAVASSDSENDEKWRTIFSSSINKEDDDSYLDSLQLSAQELFIQKPSIDDEDDGPKGDNEESENSEIPLGDEILEQPETDSDYEKREVTYTTPTLFHGLSKISEDDEENGKGSNNGCKKLPKDYCVIQEMKSENVSTEHVDFRVARKQWLEMEEQTKMAKTTVQSPTSTKPSPCQGSHSFMYTPVRNIERSRRESDLENLALGGDYPHTQFSPCSEDSGLDDLSYRSPYDDPETPVEREIRLTMEREENFRRERALSSSSSCEFMHAKTQPVVIHPNKLCQEVDEKRKMFDHQDDGCSIPRSPSNPTPSFIITSSPVKGAQKREFSANNVIILEPDAYPTSPRHYGNELGAAHPGNWNSNESSNVIILETSNLIIRSASEFCLNSASEEQQSTFLNNPFFKLRSRSTQSLVDEEIKMVKQREEELKRQRANLYTKEKFNTIVVSPNLLNSASFEKSEEMPTKCKSSPSSPMKTYKMDRSIVSCDTRFPEMYSGGRRKSAMALRWEAGEFANK